MKDGGVTDLAAAFPDLTFDRPAPRVLRITLDGPGLNSVNHAVHRQLADVWRAVDEDDETNAVVLRGAGKAFSAGGSFDLLESLVTDDAMRAQIMSEARDLVFNVIECSKVIVSAIHGPAVGAGLVVALLADVSVAARHRADHRRPHAPRRGRWRSRRDLLAAAVRHGEGQVLPAHVRRDVG